MKHSILIAAAAMLAVSCGIEPLQDTIETALTEQTIVIEAVHNDYDGDTKTVRNDDGSVSWQAGDQISLFFGSGSNGGSAFTTSDSGKTASFTGTIGAFTAGGEDFDGGMTYFWGLYPYDPAASCNNTSVTTSIPSAQRGTPGSFSPGQHVTIARSENLLMSFKSVCSGIRFSLSNTEGVRLAILKMKDGSPIAGNITVSMDQNGIPHTEFSNNMKSSISLVPDNGEFETGADYYFEFAPILAYQGFEITFYKDDAEATFSYDSSRDFKRNTFTNILNIDTHLSSWKDTDYWTVQNDIAAEEQALMSIWRSLNGENWNPEYWEPQFSWKEENPIQDWVGLTFNESGTLKTFILQTELAKGFLPDVFDVFKDLETIDISSSKIIGPFPPSIGHLHSLKSLTVRAPLSGEIPDLSGLTGLEQLNIYGASFSGSIPQSIGLMAKLRVLRIEHSGLSGTIPSEIGQLSNLEELSLSTNYLEGSIPAALCGLTSLRTLDLSSNLLGGSIPSEIGNLVSLEYLDLSGHSTLGEYEDIPEYTNCFEGEIPSSIGLLSNLRFMRLPDNKLSGSIPEELYNLSNLEVLDLGFNCLSGRLSERIANLQKLLYLRLSTNNLSGSLPDGLWTLNSLITLDLGNFYERFGRQMTNRNQFSGEISSNISNLVNLREMSVSNCNFSGDIPLGLTSLHNLYSLKLSYNNFTGTIPDGFKDMESLSVFWCQRNKLSGYISEQFIAVMGQKNLDSSMMWIVDDQQDGYGFTYGLYESTDYSRNKELRVLNRAIKGKGINIVLLGDGYVDKDINSGEYDAIMKLMNDALFEVEPFKSYKDYFNVYEIVMVSKNGTSVGETALSIDPDVLFTYSVNKNKIMGIIDELLPDINHDDLTVSIATPFSSTRPGCCWFINPEEGSNGLGLGIAVSQYKGDDETFKDIVRHEVVGHGFGKLGDEYVDTGYNSVFPEYERDIFHSYHNLNWYANLDIVSGSEQVIWKHFLNRPEYVNSGVGVYEGGKTYSKGVWRPSENSIMRSNSYGSFNAPSREAIYKRIHSIAYGDEWEYDFNDFLEWDARNLYTTSTKSVASMPSSVPETLDLSKCVIIYDSKF